MQENESLTTERIEKGRKGQSEKSAAQLKEVVPFLVLLGMR